MLRGRERSSLLSFEIGFKGEMPHLEAAPWMGGDRRLGAAGWVAVVTGGGTRGLFL